jgi:hypothetical protein
LRVRGKVIPEIVKPAPVRVAEFTVTALVPVEESVRICEVGVFTATFPKGMFAVLNESVGAGTFIGAEAFS